jgi:beta-lactamase class A
MTDFAKLQSAITAAEQAGCTLGVTAIAPDGTRLSHNGTRRFVAASTMKIPVMVELFRRIDQGRDSLDHLHVLREQDKATGGGVVKELHAGITFTVRDLCYRRDDHRHAGHGPEIGKVAETRRFHPSRLSSRTLSG